MVRKIQGMWVMVLLLAGTSLTYGQKADWKWAQNELVSYEKLDVSSASRIQLSQALERLERKFRVSFMYKSGLLDGMYVPSNAELSNNFGRELQQLLEPLNLKYSRLNNRTFAITVDLAEYKSAVLEILQHQVKGAVTDAQTGESLPGVNVIVKGTATGTATDVNGNYSLDASSGQDTLVFSFIGYQTREVPVDGRTTINVELSLQAIAGEELIVVGYGAQRRADITSAVAEIDMESVGERSITNLTNLLQGQAPGVVVRQTTGTPGQELEVNIRGISSLGAGSEPLYVIDGFPVGTSAGQNINPANIESITVLKDASSTAIYGARGSNGVILITTKSANEGEVQNIPNSRRVDMMNGVEFARFKKESFMDKIRYFEGREPSIEEVPESYRYPEETQYSTDWLDQILNQNASFQDYNISVGSGRGPVRSFVSVGYLNQRGAVIETGFERFNVRANLSGDIHENISMGWNLAGSFSREQYAPTSGRDAIIGSALWADPREPVYNEDGSFNAYIGGRDGVFGTPNPVMELMEMERNRNTGDLLTNGYMEFSILENLAFKSSINASIRNRRQKEFRPSYLAGRGFDNPPPREAYLNESHLEIFNYSTDQLLTYIMNLGNHDITLMAGFSAQEETVDNLAASGNEFSNDIVRFLDAATRVDAGSSEASWSLLAYFGRLNYNFKNKYLLSATYRREGSSRFGANNKWGNFPAVSLGWRLSEESFMPDFDWLTDLKLRGSWGVTGNNSIGNYRSLSIMNPSNYILNGEFVNGQVLGSFANADLGWEQSKQINIGMDLALLENRINFTAEAYRKITNDMLLPIEIPVISGFQSTFTNIGKVENKGLEFSLGYRKSTQDFSYTANFNISFNRNKVLEIGGENDEIRDGGMYGHYSVSRPGRPIGMLHGYKWLGIFNTEEEIDAHPTQDGAIPGTFKYADTNGDGVVSYDTEDMVEIGNPHPKFTWGLSLGGDYKRFDLSVLITGAQDYDLFRQLLKTTLNMDGVFNILAAGKDRWRSPDDPGNGVIPTSNTWKWQRESNSRYVYDASHAWVKNVTLGYTFSNIRSISNIRVYLSADNLLILSSYPGNNPEVNQLGGITPGFDDGTYPVPRIFSFGAAINF